MLLLLMNYYIIKYCLMSMYGKGKISKFNLVNSEGCIFLDTLITLEYIKYYYIKNIFYATIIIDWYFYYVLYV